MRYRIIAFVDHEIGYRLLEKLISNEKVLNYELVSIVTTKENGKMWWPGIAELCQKNKIPLLSYSDFLQGALEEIQFDWCFLFSWKYLISSELFKNIKLGVVNLHYSLLPECRGVYPINWAIIGGKKYTGVTYHLIGKGIDTGQLICQQSIPIRFSDTARTLQLRLDDLAYDLFDKMIALTIGGHLKKSAPVFLDALAGTYKSRNDFIESNKLELNSEYKVIDLLNLLRGKTFFPDSNNLYVIDPDTGKKVYITIQLHE